MHEPELFLLFIRRMNRAGYRYMVSGSVASIFYGEPRLTHDVDIIVFLSAEEIGKLDDLFPQNEFYLPPPETIFAEVARPERGHFNIIHHETGFRADIYLTGRDEVNAWGFRSRRKIDYQGEPVYSGYQHNIKLCPH